jgi:hypothetical protein
MRNEKARGVRRVSGTRSQKSDDVLWCARTQACRRIRSPKPTTLSSMKKALTAVRRLVSSELLLAIASNLATITPLCGPAWERMCCLEVKEFLLACFANGEFVFTVMAWSYHISCHWNSCFKESSWIVPKIFLFKYVQALQGSKTALNFEKLHWLSVDLRSHSH